MDVIAGSVADLYVVLDSVTDPFSKGMEKAAADAEASSGRMTKALKAVTAVGVGLAVGVGAIGVKSIDMAAQFQSTMETLHTQAGVAQSQIASLSSGVLSLAGQVGFAPDSLAEALYHIESSFASVGITGPKALDLLKVAAEGAAVGHADLVDVTNALDAAVASGIPGVQDFNQAMGVLNATVGAGDMTMQDLAGAFSTGLLANVKSFGLSITDVGAALAVFGDNNIRGQYAATELRMAVQALAKPANSAVTWLDKMGLSADAFAQVMSKQGLLPALEMLKTKMDALHVSESQQGQVLTDLFGKKAGAGIVVLYDQLDRLKSKYPDLSKGAHGFADAWTQTKSTLSQQFKDIESGADALGVRLGEFLIPQVSKLLTEAQQAFGQIEAGFKGQISGPEVKAPNMGHAGLNQIAMHLQQPTTEFQRLGQEAHSALLKVEEFGKQLEPIGKNFLTFGLDVWQAGEKLVSALTPTVELVGKGLFGALKVAGEAAANILGPAIKGFADFLDQHKGAIQFFSEVVLGGMIAKMTILGAINAAEGVLTLATAVVSFPLGQFGQIGDAVQGLKNAWTGTAATETEQAVQGLSGAFANLKQAGSNILDKVLPDSGKLAALSQAGATLGTVEQDLTGIEKAAAGAEQLSLFETNLNGIVQVADHQQLSLFETDMNGVVQAAEQAPGQLGGAAAGINGVEQAATEAEGATSSLAGAIGKFAMAGGVIGAAVVGMSLLSSWMDHLFGVGKNAALSTEELNAQFNLLGQGSSKAASDMAQTAIQMVNSSRLLGHSTQGLQQVDQGLAQVVTSGHADAAKAEFQQIATALQKQGVDAHTAASYFPQYEQAIKNAGDSAQTAGGKLQTFMNTLQQQQAVDQINQDIQNLSDSIKANGNALYGNSQAAIANRQAFNQAETDITNYANSQLSTGADVNTVSKTMQGQITQLENTATQAGITSGDVQSYTNTLNGIPKQIQTSISANINPALGSLNALLRAVDNSIGTVTINGQVGVGNLHGAVAMKAGGGAVEAGHTYWVGEKGPELVTFGASGYITPNDMLQPAALAGARSGAGGAGGGTVNNYFITQVAGSVLTERKLVDVVRTVVLQYNNRNSVNGLSLP